MLISLPEKNVLFEIAVQAIGFLGIAASVISFQCKKYGNIIVFRILNESLFAFQYLLLGAFTGAAMNAAGSVRNAVFLILKKKEKKTLPFQIIFSLLFVISGILAWQGYVSLLIIGAKVLSTFAYGSDDPKKIRLLIFVTGICWLVYNSCVRSYAGVLCEGFTVVSIIISFIRFDLVKK